MVRVATFNGKYNQTKSKLILLLAQESKTWFSPHQMHNILGVPLESCRGTLRHLNRYTPPYVLRRRVDDSPSPWGQFHYEYRISTRGGVWYANALNAGMPVDRYMAEVELWQREHGIN